MPQETMADKRDYYEVLGLRRSASNDEIRRAYRKLARQYHPDVNRENGAEDRFKEITEAYEVLSDDQRRAAYDRFGHAAAGMGGMGGMGSDPFGFGTAGSPFADIFESFFGGTATGGRRRAAPARGVDLQVTLEVSFEEAIYGAEKEVELTRMETCDACHGTRMRDGQTPPRCATCGGSGEVRRVQQTILGQLMTASPCSACGGTGVTITDPCPNCRGRGRVTRARTISVTVPAGIDENATLRLTGQGEASTEGGPAGNLYVKIRVQPHPIFTRSGKTIQSEIGVNVAQAALGDELEIDTIDGPVEFKLPSGTQSSQQFRLRGRGAPDIRGGDRGDQIVTVHVVTPRNLSSEQRELFEALGATMGNDVILQQPADRPSFFSKIRDAIGSFLL